MSILSPSAREYLACVLESEGASAEILEAWNLRARGRTYPELAAAQKVARQTANNRVRRAASELRRIEGHYGWGPHTPQAQHRLRRVVYTISCVLTKDEQLLRDSAGPPF